MEQKKKSQTIQSYICTIKAVLANVGVKLNQDQFLLNSLTRVCKFKNDQARTKLPIHKGLLGLIVKAVDDLYLNKENQPYLAVLYKAMFVAAYHGLLRISEVTTSPHCVIVRDVKISTNKKNDVVTLLHLLSRKIMML